VRPGSEELADLILGNYITTSTTIVRRSVLEQVGPFNTALFGPEDWDCWLRIAAAAAVAHVAEPVVGYRVHATSITANYTPEPWLEMHSEILDRLFAESPVARRYAFLRSRIDARLDAVAASLSYGNARMALARRYGRRALVSSLRNRQWRTSAECLWLITKSLIPSAIRPSLRRASRGLLVGLTARRFPARVSSI
jgi:hypothetical protein